MSKRKDYTDGKLPVKRLREDEHQDLSAKQQKKDDEPTKLPPTYTDYDAFQLEPPFCIGFAAPPKSGKTFLINKLIVEKWQYQFDNIVIASPSLEFKDEYPIESQVDQDKVNIIKIRSNFKQKLDQVILEQQDHAKRNEADPKENPLTQTLIILDDCIDSRLMAYKSSENIVDQIVERGRHFAGSLVCSAQHLTGMSPSFRKNATALFIFSPTSYAETQRLLQEFVPAENKKEFFSLLVTVFKYKHAFLLIDNSVDNRKYYKLRFRKGFKDLLFPMKPDELKESKLMFNLNDYTGDDHEEGNNSE